MSKCAAIKQSPVGCLRSSTHPFVSVYVVQMLSLSATGAVLEGRVEQLQRELDALKADARAQEKTWTGTDRRNVRETPDKTKGPSSNFFYLGVRDLGWRSGIRLKTPCAPKSVRPAPPSSLDFPVNRRFIGWYHHVALYKQCFVL